MSPDGRLQAVVYMTDEGATNSKGFHVAVTTILGTALFSDDVYVVDKTGAQAQPGVSWSGANELVIRPIKGQAIMARTETMVGGRRILVSYDSDGSRPAAHRGQ